MCVYIYILLYILHMTLLILFVYQSQGEKHRWPQDSTVAKGLQADGLTTGSDQKPLLHK